MEQDAFQVESYNDYLASGENLKIERMIYANELVLGPELSMLIQNNTEEELEQLQEKYKKEELAAFEKVKAQAEEWVEVAKKVRKIELALAFLNVLGVEHTNNEWKVTKEGYSTMHSISNKTYRMWFRVYERTKWIKGEEFPTAWEVMWKLSTNSIARERVFEIAGQMNKKFKIKEKCMKYVEGRKKAYEHLFQEVQPKIMKGYEQAFMVSGMLLPGYQVEESK